MFRTLIATGLIAAAGMFTAAPAFADTTDTDPSISSPANCSTCAIIAGPLNTVMSTFDGVQDGLTTGIPVIGPVVGPLLETGETVLGTLGSTLTSTTTGLLGSLANLGGTGTTGTTP